MKHISLTVLCFFMCCNIAPIFAAEDNLLEFQSSNVPITNIVPKKEANDGTFSLTTIMDTFLNFGQNANLENLEENERQRLAFVEATKKFNQGNVVVAYSDFENLLEVINSDYALLVFAKSMYEIGLFSVGNKSLEKIKHKSFLKDLVENLKNSYLPLYTPDKNEEIYLAKAYSSIHFDNSAQEIAFELNKNTEIMSKSDYANYILAQAMKETGQYQQALIFVNKARQMNPKNVAYINFEVNILTNYKKYKDALKLIELNENLIENNYIFKNNFMVQKQNILANLTKDDSEKKYYLAYKTFLEGNYQKAIKDCKNIVNFDKNNYKALTLMALGQFISGNTEEAKKNYLKSYEINKNYPLTLSGLGDCKFLEYNLEQAAQYYKKALSKDPNDQTSALKLALIYKNNPKYSKDLKNLEKKLAKMNPTPYMSYQSIAATIARGNQNLRGEYIKKATSINPLYENGWVAFLNYELDNKHLDVAKNFLYMISFSNRTNYTYFYLNALYDIKTGKKERAVVNLKNCLSLNPDFEEASKKLLELIPSEYKSLEQREISPNLIDQPVL